MTKTILRTGPERTALWQPSHSITVPHANIPAATSSCSVATSPSWAKARWVPLMPCSWCTTSRFRKTRPEDNQPQRARMWVTPSMWTAWRVPLLNQRFDGCLVDAFLFGFWLYLGCWSANDKGLCRCASFDQETLVCKKGVNCNLY